METFRLFVDEASKGAVNMARDEALLRSVINGRSPPCVRFYRWKPPALSLGYLQRISEEIDIEMCKDHGFDHVRRLTGGKAVLHDDELTYSVIIPANHEKMEGRGVMASYRTISRALVRSMSLCGISCSMAPNRMTQRKGGLSTVCFENPSAYEVICRGKKIIGSAQTRDRGVILQHGSVPIEWDLRSMFDVMGIPSNDREMYENVFNNRATNITGILGGRMEFDELVPCFIRGFEDSLEIDLIHSSYTSEERSLIDELTEERYGSDDWNKMR